MDNFASSCVSLISFDQIYNQNIRPKLEAIDIFLKTKTAPYDINEVAMLFNTNPLHILKTMDELSITDLDKLNLFSLILTLPNDICHLIKRQWQYSARKSYTPEMIAFIYNLNIHKVKNAFEDLGVEYIEDHEITNVFKRIHTTIFKSSY